MSEWNKDPLSFLRETLTTHRGQASSRDIDKVKEVLEDPTVPGDRIIGVFLRRQKEAEALLRDVLRAYPDDLNVRIFLVDLLEAEGRYGEAEEEYRVLIKAGAGPYPRLDYAWILGRLKRYREAEAQIREALREEPEEPLIWVEYGGLLEEMGRWGKAKKAYKTALALIPPGSESRKILKDKIKDKDSVDLWYEGPTVGTLGRFLLMFPQEIQNHLEKMTDEGFWEEVERRYAVDEGPYLKRARETGGYRETLLEVEDAKERTTVDNPEEWAFYEEIDILEVWKPGFELMMNQMFYDAKCKDCGRAEEKRQGCREGLSNCPYDTEFEEFEREYVRKIIDKLREGVELQSIQEIEVSEQLRELAVRTRKSVRTGIKVR